MKIKLARLSAAIIGACLLSVVFQVQAADKEPISPIKPAKVTNPAVVELGKKLFFDPRLSKSGFISCNSSHNLSMGGGSDNLSSSIGHTWQRGPINSPTVLNSSMNVAQFWDGRAKNLKEQAGGPIANSGGMAFTHELVFDMLASIPAYRAEFKKAFKKEWPPNIEKVTLAIAAFEETLVSPNSRFDQWLGGKMSHRPKTSWQAINYSRTVAAWPATTAQRWTSWVCCSWVANSMTTRTPRSWPF
jgi:cytochrome c peroxidase